MGFSTPQTANPEATATTGNALASFLLGVPDNGSFENASAGMYGGMIMGVYGEDQWKITPRLTMNAGIRYDLNMLPPWGKASDGTNAVGTLDMHNGTYLLQVNPGPCTTLRLAPCIPGGLPQPNIELSPNGKVIQTNTDNIQPRLGLSYALNSKTAFHVAGGIYYDAWDEFEQTDQDMAGNWPQVLSAS